ncbi:MAG: Xaa-Pro aminopeptidase [Panacagrimonas sp.]
MPLTAAERREFAARRKQFGKRIGRHGIAIIPAASEVIRARDTHYRFRQHSDFQYLSGFGEPDAIAVIAPGRKDGAFVLFVRPRDKQREIWDGRRAGPEGAVADYGADQAFELADFDGKLAELLAGRQAVHYELGEFPHLDQPIAANLRRLREISRRGASVPDRIVSLSASLHEMRLIKRPAEIRLLKKAATVSAQAHLRAMRATQPGKQEWQIAAEIHSEFEAADMQPGYGSIVAGGENACILHYVENSAPLRDGDLLLIDAGGEYRGYTADITRTFPVNGRFSAAQQAVYEIVLEAQLAAIEAMRPGVSSATPHDVASKVLTQGMVDLKLLRGDPKELMARGEQRQFFMHGTGHWLGMDVHDVGSYRTDGKPRAFEPGMVMTVEPGLYIAPDSKGVPARFRGIGVRIEDDVLITAKSCEVLTGAVPKTPSDVERLMAGAG